MNNFRAKQKYIKNIKPPKLLNLKRFKTKIKTKINRGKKWEIINIKLLKPNSKTPHPRMNRIEYICSRNSQEMKSGKKKESLFVPEEDRLINVEKAIRDKNPKLLKWMPGFLLRYIKRILHEDDLNSLFYRTRNSSISEFMDIGMKEMGPIVTYEGLENLPKEGGIYLTANHPLGGLDGAALIQVCLKVRPDLKFFVNDVLMQVKTMENIFVPVNKLGRNDKRNKEAFEKVYNSENCLIIFPAGMVSRRQKGRKILDLRWKKSIVQKSIEYNKPILPVHIEAANSKKFYNLSYWRKKLGIRANLEMFFLADEMYKQNGKRIHITFGKPLPASTFTKDKRPEKWVQWLKEHVYSLATQKKD